MSNVQKKEVHVLQYPSEAAVALLSKLDVILNQQLTWDLYTRPSDDSKLKHKGTTQYTLEAYWRFGWTQHYVIVYK